MNNEVEELVEKAQKILSRTGNKPGTRYPNSLKRIVISLRVDHQISIKEVVKLVPISVYSAREWPRKSIESKFFNKVVVQHDAHVKISKKINTYYKIELDLIIFNQRALLVLITLLIFESLASHLFH